MGKTVYEQMFKSKDGDKVHEQRLKAKFRKSLEKTHKRQGWRKFYEQTLEDEFGGKTVHEKTYKTRVRKSGTLCHCSVT